MASSKIEKVIFASGMQEKIALACPEKSKLIRCRVDCELLCPESETNRVKSWQGSVGKREREGEREREREGEGERERDLVTCVPRRGLKRISCLLPLFEIFENSSILPVFLVTDACMALNFFAQHL